MRKTFALIVAVVGVSLSPPAGGAAAESAKEIFDATGVRGGLVVHIGCGDGKLTAALRANDSYLVHGLEADASNVAKARRHIRKLGLYGKVSVERWPDAMRHPPSRLLFLISGPDP